MLNDIITDELRKEIIGDLLKTVFLIVAEEITRAVIQDVRNKAQIFFQQA